MANRLDDLDQLLAGIPHDADRQPPNANTAEEFLIEMRAVNHPTQAAPAAPAASAPPVPTPQVAPPQPPHHTAPHHVAPHHAAAAQVTFSAPVAPVPAPVPAGPFVRKPNDSWMKRTALNCIVDFGDGKDMGSMFYKNGKSFIRFRPTVTPLFPVIELVVSLERPQAQCQNQSP